MSERARTFAILTNVALVLFIGACAPKTAAPVTTPPAGARLSPEEQLRKDLQAIFTDNAVDHAVWSVSVQSLKQGGTLYSLNPTRMLTPASNQKLITSATEQPTMSRPPTNSPQRMFFSSMNEAKSRDSASRGARGGGGGATGSAAAASRLAVYSRTR